MLTCVAHAQASDPFFRTLVLHHSDCLEIEARKSAPIQWEAPLRITAIMAALRNERWFRDDALTFKEQFRPATQAMLERAHSKRWALHAACTLRCCC